MYIKVVFTSKIWSMSADMKYGDVLEIWTFWTDTLNILVPIPKLSARLTVISSVPRSAVTVGAKLKTLLEY